MTLLEIVILAHRCRTTHHFIAFDALQLLSGADAQDWKNLLLRHHAKLLKGARAPDTEFKDFQNHVLHVQEGEWGGARDAAMLWYGKAVEALRAQKWGKAAYALGVLTHYYSDPIHPFHTAQSEEDAAIHKAVEWSTSQARATLKARIDARTYPHVRAGYQTGFVADMVLEGARYANQHYATLIDHYDMDRAMMDPQSGLDDRLLDILADLIAFATSGVAVLFERAFAEAGVKPQKVDLDLPGYLAALDIPVRKFTRKLQDASDRRAVEKNYQELLTTGKVIQTLAKDNKAIRSLHARQVLRKPLAQLDVEPLEPLGSRHIPSDRHDLPVRYELRIVPVPTQRPIRSEATARDVVLPCDMPPVSACTEASEAMPNLAANTSEEVKTAALSNLDNPEGLEEAIVAVPEPNLQAGADKAETICQFGPEPELKEAQTDAETKGGDTYNRSRTVPDKHTEPATEPITQHVARAAAEQSEPAPKAKRLSVDDPVVNAPSIGPKTAARFEKIDILTISDLLAADPGAAATNLNVRYIKAETIADWQDQTRLLLDAPGLRVLDSQILIGVGIRSVDDLAKASATRIFKAATRFLDTPQGARILWGGDNAVEKAHVEHWIDLARTAHDQAA